MDFLTVWEFGDCGECLHCFCM